MSSAVVPLPRPAVDEGRFSRRPKVTVRVDSEKCIGWEEDGGAGEVVFLGREPRVRVCVRIRLGNQVQ